MRKLNLQKFAFDNNNYCDFSSAASKAVAGRDIILAVFNSSGDKLLAISGQQGLTINRSAESIEISSKDSEGGWKSKISGMKEWSVELEGIYVTGDESHNELSKAFTDGIPVCLKVINKKTSKGMFGGLAVISDYPLEAPFDDTMTYSITFDGMGALIDLTIKPSSTDSMPESTAGLGELTVVSVAHTSTSGRTSVYVNPVKTGGNKYKYRTGKTVNYPAYMEDCTSATDWDGTAPIQAVTGDDILIIECNSANKALKAGIAKVTSKA